MIYVDFFRATLGHKGHFGIERHFGEFSFGFIPKADKIAGIFYRGLDFIRVNPGSCQATVLFALYFGDDNTAQKAGCTHAATGQSGHTGFKSNRFFLGGGHFFRTNFVADAHVLEQIAIAEDRYAEVDIFARTVSPVVVVGAYDNFDEPFNGLSLHRNADRYTCEKK